MASNVSDAILSSKSNDELIVQTVELYDYEDLHNTGSEVDIEATATVAADSAAVLKSVSSGNIDEAIKDSVHKYARSTSHTL
jgi:hypothetical protein